MDATPSPQVLVETSVFFVSRYRDRESPSFPVYNKNRGEVTGDYEPA